MDKWLTIVAVIAIIALLVLFVAIPVHSREGDYETETITVHYGDTLTAYAQTYAPNMAVRDYVDEIRRMNHLQSGMIYAGDELTILKEVR